MKGALEVLRSELAVRPSNLEIVDELLEAFVAERVDQPGGVVGLVGGDLLHRIAEETGGQVLTPADEENHVFKHNFTVPFVCGCRNLGEALRRIGEGAAMMRTKGEAGSGDIVAALFGGKSSKWRNARMAKLLSDLEGLPDDEKQNQILHVRAFQGTHADVAVDALTRLLETETVEEQQDTATKQW